VASRSAVNHDSRRDPHGHDSDIGAEGRYVTVHHLYGLINISCTSLLILTREKRVLLLPSTVNMHFSSQSLLLALSAPFASAFPAGVLEAAASDPAILARAAEISKSLVGRQTGADAATALFEAVPRFNAEAQYINVTKGSGHEYVPPGPNDIRGPCPGLNAFANHSRCTASIMRF
jgi:hypothetical protein